MNYACHCMANTFLRASQTVQVVARICCFHSKNCQNTTCLNTRGNASYGDVRGIRMEGKAEEKSVHSSLDQYELCRGKAQCQLF